MVAEWTVTVPPEPVLSDYITIGMLATLFVIGAPLNLVAFQQLAEQVLIDCSRCFYYIMKSAGGGATRSLAAVEAALERERSHDTVRLCALEDLLDAHVRVEGRRCTMSRYQIPRHARIPGDNT